MDTLTPQQLCPLCQKANACAIAQTGNMTSHCWCMQVRINSEVLAQLSTAQKNIACICQACAGVLKTL